MKLPNPERVVIAPEKLRLYLLNVEHRRGGPKARLLADFGYHQANWRQLEADIRQYHLEADVDITRPTAYGTRYEIRAPLQTPSGRALTVRTIWQLEPGADAVRLITLFPD